MLSKSPDEINLWDLLLLLESKFSLVDCLVDEGACENTQNCPVRPVWGKALEAMAQIFKETTLVGILQNAKERAGENG